MTHDEFPMVWRVVGLCGQALFFSRFLVQWIASERSRRTMIPVAFWWLSLCGGSVLLSYAIARRDPVFILGQAGGLVVYGGNLMIIRRTRDAARPVD